MAQVQIINDFCSIDNCLRVRRYKNGHCGIHYNQIRRLGCISGNPVRSTCLNGCVYWMESKGVCGKCDEKKQRLNPKRKEYLARKAMEYYKKDPEKFKKRLRIANRKYAYGLSEIDFQGLLLRQDNKCAICRTDNNKGVSFSVDHNHDNGKIRGLLCNQCNRGIGLLKENINILTSAIKYIEQDGLQ